MAVDGVQPKMLKILFARDGEATRRITSDPALALPGAPAVS